MRRKGYIIFIYTTIVILLAITGFVGYKIYQQMKENPIEEINQGKVESTEKESPSSSQSSSDTKEDLSNNDTLTEGNLVDNPKEETSKDSLSRDELTDSKNNENTKEVSKNEIILTFAGDVNLDDSSKTVARYDQQNKGLEGVFSNNIIEEMINADIFMVNNEFAFSTRGTKTPDKSYTFRGKPERVQILKDMGVDIVSLANNHALDYGVDALLDTFTTLEEADIDYIGAGRTMDRAKAATYYEIGDTTIAYLAASRVIFSTDWYATDSRPGMFGTYDPTVLIEEIKEAKKKSDYVIVYVHWGKEGTTELLPYQITMAKQYIDAGADAVIGCHPHVLQGMEFYKGKIIAYSLGNYWFNGKTCDTGLLKLYLKKGEDIKVQLLPARQEGAYTALLEKESEIKAYFEHMTKISYNVTFDQEGYVTATSPN